MRLVCPAVATAFINAATFASRRHSFPSCTRMASTNDDSSKQETKFNHMELKNWEQAYEAYDQGFGPLTRQTIPTLLESAGFPPVTTSGDESAVRLLDVATGPGFVLSAAIDSVSANERQKQQPYHLTGLDITQNFLSLAKQRIDEQLNHGSVQMEVDFVEGSAESLPFPDNTFDSIICNFGILHFFKPRVFLHESFRCLRPGGKVSFSCWAPPTRTEGFQISLEAIGEVGNPNVDALPSGPNFFDFGDSEQAMALKEVGFEDTKFIELSEMKWKNIKNGAMLYDVLLEGTSRTREILLGQTAEETVAIRSFMDKKYDTITNGGERPLAMPAVVSSGKKPF